MNNTVAFSNFAIRIKFDVCVPGASFREGLAFGVAIICGVHVVATCFCHSPSSSDGTCRGSAQSGKENGGDDTLDIHGV